MSVIKCPYALIMNKKSGSRIIVDHDLDLEVSIPILWFSKGYLDGGEVIDSGGWVYRIIRSDFLGLDWDLYKQQSVTGFFCFLMDVFLLSVMVKVRINIEEQCVGLALPEMINKLTSTILKGTYAYTHVPHKEIISRLKKARTKELVIESIYRD